MATLEFDITNKQITVPSPATEITVQEIYDQSKDFEDSPVMMSHPIICTASGKEPLGAGVFVGITVTMQNGWKVGFEARPGPTTIGVVIDGGNLVDSTGVVGAQFFATAFTQIQYASSSSATLTTVLSAQQIRDAMLLAPTPGTPAVGSIDRMLEEVWQVETGTWKIISDQMIFYERDGVTEVFRRNLLDVTDALSTANATQGVRV